MLLLYAFDPFLVMIATLSPIMAGKDVGFLPESYTSLACIRVCILCIGIIWMHKLTPKIESIHMHTVRT